MVATTPAGVSVFRLPLCVAQFVSLVVEEEEVEEREERVLLVQFRRGRKRWVIFVLSHFANSLFNALSGGKVVGFAVLQPHCITPCQCWAAAASSCIITSVSLRLRTAWSCSFSPGVHSPLSSSPHGLWITVFLLLSLSFASSYKHKHHGGGESENHNRQN